jgi:hypothetical protein
MVKVLIAIPPDIARVSAPANFPSVTHRRLGEGGNASLPFGAIGNHRPADNNGRYVGRGQSSGCIACFCHGNPCIYPVKTMSDSDSAICKPTAMSLGVPVVITLSAGARVGQVINNLIFLPGGRTGTLSSTVTQEDIHAGRIIRMISDRDLE